MLRRSFLYSKKLGLADLRNFAAGYGEPERQSGKQEQLENRMNDLMFA